MKTAVKSSPGKIILSGEHAVVYGAPCLVSAIKQKITVKVKKSDENYIALHLRDDFFDYRIPLNKLNINNHPRRTIFVMKAVSFFFEKYKLHSGLDIITKSDFLTLYGLGSSSAVTVAAITALSQLFDLSISQSDIFDLSLKVVISVQGKSSGIDLATAIYGGVLYYRLNKPVEILPEKYIPLLVVYSGNKAETQVLINRVSEFKKENPKKVNQIFSQIGGIVKEARQAFLDSNWQYLGSLFNQNHSLLVELGVSTEKLDLLRQVALKQGALGAKLSGAGGGDNLIVLYKFDDKEKLITELEKNGGKILDVI